MRIPKGVNHLAFYVAAKKQGIRIESWYIGVTLNINGRAPNWLAQVQSKGKKLAFKRFPFNEKGEEQAGKFYSNYTTQHCITPRFEMKKRYKKRIHD
jgi:hypothetical protein